ncbi:MAG: efflux RND transporter periplasmic adaptor subunit [Ignavibacteria bacterium]|nr:efflux RND transporter periplasmic adaptor subunit [Ignavibacteria bacterium]
MKFFQNSIFFVILIIALSILNGCSDSSKVNPENKPGEVNKEHSNEHNDELNSEVLLTDEQIKFMEIKTEKLKLQNISGYIKVNGEVVINPDHESKVGSIIPGRIKKIYVKEGAFVRAGQTLAIIENPELINVQVEYINAKNEYEYSKKEYERQLKLNNDNIGSKKTLNELETNYKKALANYKTLEVKLAAYRISKHKYDDLYSDTVANLQRYYSVTAPISGNIVERNVTVGQYVEPTGDMFHIINTSNIFADLNVFEKDLPFISTGQKVSLEVSVNPYEIYEGTISFINKVFDDEKRTVKVRVAINNIREKLLPNMFLQAKIYIKQESVLAVPISSVENEGETKFVFVKTSETKEIEDHHDEESEKNHNESSNNDEHKKGIVFKKVRVNTGISDDKFVQIFPIDDISIDEEIVINGSYYLKSELQKGDLNHDHSH